MAAYDAKKRRASPKRAVRTRKSSKKKRASKTISKELVKKKRKKAISRRPTVGKKPAKALEKKPKKRAKKAAKTLEKKPAKATAKKSRAKKTAKKPSKVLDKKPKRHATKATKALEKKPKKRATKPKALEKKKKRAATKRLRARVKRLVQKQQSVKGRSKKSPARTPAKREKKRIEKSRLDRALDREKLPRKTPRQRAKSQKENWKRKRPLFQRLLDHARKSGQLAQQTGSGTRTKHKVDNQHNIGVQRLVRIERILSSDSVEEILYKVDRAIRSARWMHAPRGRFLIWYANIDFSTYGENLFGSGNVILDASGLDDPEAQDAADMFSIGHDNTGVWSTYEGVMNALRDLLEGYAEESRNVVFLHNVKVMNFNRKKDRR